MTLALLWQITLGSWITAALILLARLLFGRWLTPRGRYLLWLPLLLRLRFRPGFGFADIP